MDYLLDIGLLQETGKRLAAASPNDWRESDQALAQAFVEWLPAFRDRIGSLRAPLVLLSEDSEPLLALVDAGSPDPFGIGLPREAAFAVRGETGRPVGYLIIPGGSAGAEGLTGWLAASFALHCHWRRALQAKERQLKENAMREVVFEATKRIHAMIDVDAILSELVQSIRMLYPLAQVELYLSQDNQGAKVEIKALSFHRQDQNLELQAFLEGRPVSDRSAVAVPLGGKQGVYGVVKLSSSGPPMQPADYQYIIVLADTAGIAFENARLHQQASMIINELRLINEITKRLSQSLKLNDIFAFTSMELIEIFKADYCCILQFDREQQEFVLKATNTPLFSREYFPLDYGFSGHIYRNKEPVIISDYRQSDTESQFMNDTGARSLIASPILVNAEVLGVILIAHHSPNFFSYENFRLLQSLSGHIGLAITNASLHAEVRRMVITDQLTKLNSRHYLDEQINLRQKSDSCGSLILIDIDNFKRVNDTFGHQTGDQILMQVGRIILSCIRDTDIAARWGGEELAVYLPHALKEQTYRVAERIRLRVREETDPGVSISCGISDWRWGEDKVSVEHLFYLADMALYEAKRAGKNTIKLSGDGSAPGQGAEPNGTED